MFKSKTVFVVGAGASHEVGLPVGTGLKQKILEKIDFKINNFGEQTAGCNKILLALETHLKQRNLSLQLIDSDISALCRALKRADSIDYALCSLKDRQAVEVCGKMGIVSSILNAERQSALFFASRHDQFPELSRLDNTWYARFSSMLANNISQENIENIFDNVSFVIFNYDRCIEQYIYLELQQRLAISESRTKELLGKLKIFHPYGSIGQIEWQNSEQNVPYGATRNDLLNISQNIKTFNEDLKGSEMIANMRNHIAEAETIVFLGLAFHEQNMELLSPQRDCQAKRIYATAYNRSTSDCDVAEKAICSYFQVKKKSSIEIKKDMTCKQLLDEYSSTLTAAHS